MFSAVSANISGMCLAPARPAGCGGHRAPPWRGHPRRCTPRPACTRAGGEPLGGRGGGRGGRGGRGRGGPAGGRRAWEAAEGRRGARGVGQPSRARGGPTGSAAAGARARARGEGAWRRQPGRHPSRGARQSGRNESAGIATRFRLFGPGTMSALSQMACGGREHGPVGLSVHNHPLTPSGCAPARLRAAAACAPPATPGTARPQPKP